MLSIDREDAVLLLVLDRPEKRNALHPRLISELSMALDRTADDEDIRAVVLTGAGESFCAGLDLRHLSRLDVEERVTYMRSAFALFQRIYELPQPVIAAVNGPAMAGGFDLAAFSDIRLCSPEARFAQTEILLGLTQIMSPIYEVIGLGRAKELAMTGRSVAAEEAYRIGLVHAVHPRGELLGEARKLAGELARRPPEALRATKRLSREVIDMDTRQAMTRMFDVIATRLRSEEHHEAAESYVRRIGRSQ